MKKIHWFTIQNLKEDLRAGDVFEITDIEIIKQASKVLRLDVGEHVFIKSEGFGYESEVKELHKNTLIVEIKEKQIQEENRKLALMFCIPKKDKFELIIEKCTEIGVTDFYPVISDRTVKTNINIDRARKIIQEASEQAQRLNVPILHTISKLEDVLDELRPIVFDVEGTPFSNQKIPHQVRDDKEVTTFLIGPEGGFSQRELELFKQKGLEIYKIGETVLKTETAAIVVSGLFLN